MTGQEDDLGPKDGGEAAWLALAVAHAPAIHYVAEVSGEVEAGPALRFLSTNVEAITGHPAAAFRDDPSFHFDCIHPGDRAAYLDGMATLIREGRHDLEYRFAGASQAYLWVRDSLRLLDGAADAVTYAGCMVEVAAEAQGRPQLLEEAIESLSEGFALFDSDDRLILCNSQFRAFNRQTEDILLPGVTWLDFIRAGAERGQYCAAQGRLDAWLEEAVAERGKPTNRVFEQSDGRWFESSHRVTPQNGLLITRRDITERKRIEIALLEEQELVRRVLETVPVPISVTRLRDRFILYESPAMSAIFLEDESELATHTGTHDRDPRQREEYLRRVAEEGAVNDFEIDFRRLDGSEFTGAVSGRRIDYHGEEVVVAVTIDLTEIKRRETELRQARETLEDAIEALNEGFVLFDADERFVMCNQRYRDFNSKTADKLKPGVPRAEFMRAALQRGQFPAFIGREQQVLNDYADGGLVGALGQTFEFEQDDGRWFVSSHQRTRQGGFVGTRIETTERVKMERALRESESMLRGVLDACPLPITMYRLRDAVIIYESPAARQLFGPMDGVPTVRESWASSEAQAAFLEALTSRRAIDGMDVELVRAGGEIFRATVSARLIEYDGEDLVVSAVYDLTERRAAEDEIARQRELLHQSEKLSALGQVLASVAHELNNPLSVLVGQSFMLQELAEDPKIAERAEKVGNAANRCARIVKTFLAMARQQPTEQMQVEVNQVVEAALEVTGYSLRASGIDVSLSLADGLPAILADADQLQQVLTNLIVNAQHALDGNEGSRTLRIATRLRCAATPGGVPGKPDPGQVEILVADNGPGIPEEIRARVFEPLFTTKTQGAGTGVGLALSHRLVELHGGTIEIEESPHPGAVFVVRFPACGGMPAEAQAEMLRPPCAPRAASSGHRILVIDDEPDVADFLAEVLTGAGHQVALSTSGAETLRHLESGPFDVILSDIRMPEIDGPALFKLLGDRWPESVPVLAFITGDTLSSRVKAFLDSSGRPFIGKPITPDEVRDLVARVAKRR